MLPVVACQQGALARVDPGAYASALSTALTGASPQLQGYGAAYDALLAAAPPAALTPEGVAKAHREVRKRCTRPFAPGEGYAAALDIIPPRIEVLRPTHVIDGCTIAAGAAHPSAPSSPTYTPTHTPYLQAAELAQDMRVRRRRSFAAVVGRMPIPSAEAEAALVSAPSRRDQCRPCVLWAILE